MIRFFKSNSVTDKGFLLSPDDVARQFWASDGARRWLIDQVGLLERFALNWVNEHIGQWENIPGDWEPIFDAIHAARPWATENTDPTT